MILLAITWIFAVVVPTKTTIRIGVDLATRTTGGGPPSTNYELRQDGGLELRQDGGIELRQ